MKSDMIYEDSQIVALRDINPQAPVHLLIIPKQHIGTVHEMAESDLHLTGKMIQIAQKLAGSENIGEGGYRLVVNHGSNGGQTVGHLHMHLLGGRRMTWPPG